MNKYLLNAHDLGINLYYLLIYIFKYKQLKIEGKSNTNTHKHNRLLRFLDIVPNTNYTKPIPTSSKFMKPLHWISLFFFDFHPIKIQNQRHSKKASYHKLKFK